MPAALNLTGHRSGRLTIVRRDRSNRHGVYWYCICKCGRQVTVKATMLARKRTRSCGCGRTDGAAIANANKFRDLTGQRFGRLKALDIAFRRGKVCFWKCRCDCGEKKIVNGKSLKRGATQSCGCLQRERASEARNRAVNSQPREKGKFIKRDTEMTN